MNKKIVTIVILSATVIFGLPTFIKSPYCALALGDVDLYYELKANRLAGPYCDEIAGDDDAAYEICFGPAQRRYLAKLRK